jgi:hypothetical protein
MLFVYLIEMKCTKLTLVYFHIGEGFITNGIIVQLEHRKWKIYGKCQRGKMLIDPLILHITSSIELYSDYIGQNWDLEGPGTCTLTENVYTSKPLQMPFLHGI